MLAKLLVFCAGLGIVWYVVCILLVSFVEKRPTPEFYQFMALSVTTIGTALAAFVGMVLGFERVNDKAARAGAPATPLTQLSSIQSVAAWVYPLSLLLALIIWAIKAFSGTTCDPIITELGKSLLGFAAGAIAVALNNR